jgi:hypothetical protein
VGEGEGGRGRGERLKRISGKLYRRAWGLRTYLNMIKSKIFTLHQFLYNFPF